MIVRIASAALEWAFAALAVAAAVQAGIAHSPLLIGISAVAAIIASLLRGMAFGRATARRSDAMLAALRPILRPANDERGTP